jgi:hypothetical protein
MASALLVVASCAWHRPENRLHDPDDRYETIQKPALPLCHEHGLAVIAAKGEVGRLLCIERNLPLQFPLRAQHRDGAFPYPRHKQVPFGVGAQAVDVEIVENRFTSLGERRCVPSIRYDQTSPVSDSPT